MEHSNDIFDNIHGTDIYGTDEESSESGDSINENALLPGGAKPNSLDFAVVARQMFDGETPERSIHGKTSLSEAKSLSEDGVPIIPIPWFDRKTN